MLQLPKLPVPLHGTPPIFLLGPFQPLLIGFYKAMTVWLSSGFEQDLDKIPVSFDHSCVEPMYAGSHIDIGAMLEEKVDSGSTLMETPGELKCGLQSCSVLPTTDVVHVDTVIEQRLQDLFCIRIADVSGSVPGAPKSSASDVNIGAMFD
ncbi:hypothetical protein K4K50_002686 [Colletotrichum sp. SAR 10_71]|nr:hypothetical protein K4K50_002686 [Colletotrichum sp. SAR 10_71]KAI8251589.1 hypothetical protein K4K53_012010 [Colletotrichum sp. SAR 10_77]